MGMAHFHANPKILINVNFASDPGLMDQFDAWFKEEFKRPRSDRLERLYGVHGCYGNLEIPDAEKVVEWLKAHGVEPRR